MTYLVITAFWLLPVIIAFGRKCYPERCIAIGLICLLLGWTIIGWAFALIWSVDSPSQRRYG
jgi:hypothetical protein